MANRRKRKIKFSDRMGDESGNDSIEAILGGDMLAYRAMNKNDPSPLGGYFPWLYYNFKGACRLEVSPYGGRQLLRFGAFVLNFPIGVSDGGTYYNTATGESGSIGAEAFIGYTHEGTPVDVIYSLSKADGSPFDKTPVTEEPASPEDGDLLIRNDALYEYDGLGAVWVPVTSTYIKMTFDPLVDLGDNPFTLKSLFKAGDGLHFENAPIDDGVPESINGDHIISAVGADYIVIPGLIGASVTVQMVGHGMSIKREIPKMDFVFECQNRLWGCRYSVLQEGSFEAVNEVYCSALGDFKNWRKYEGISTDSWAASVGVPGRFTGAINYMGYPMFFKEDCILRVSVSAKGAHQINHIMSTGVQDGSGKSLAIINNILYYKANDGIYAYQGGYPYKISDTLGGVFYRKAVGGSLDGRYYLSMEDSSGKRSLFVYDTERKLWMREDDLNVIEFATADDALWCLTNDTGADHVYKTKLRILYGEEHHELSSEGGFIPPTDPHVDEWEASDDEADFPWSCETGIQYYEYPDKKYLSRFNIRLIMERGAQMDIFFEYDSSGRWERAGRIRFDGTNTVTIPVKPRRCDHMRMKLSGIGDVRVYSITRILEEGSDV